MSDTDQSLYNLRYNQVTQGMEGFGGGTPMWTPLTISVGSGIDQLTGDVTAGPGTGSQVATIASSLTGKTFTSQVLINPTTNQLVLGGVAGGHTVTLTAPAPAANRVYTLPDTGTTNSAFIMDHGASQSINGNLTLAFITATGFILTSSSFLTEIGTDHASGSPQNTIIPDTGSGSTSRFVVTESAQTLNGTYTFSKAQVLNATALATSGTITPDATLGPTFTIAVAGAVTLNGPSSGTDGQKVTFRILNDGSHAVTLATGSGNFRFGTDITAYTNSVSLTDYIGAIWNNGASRWDVVSVIQGF